MDAQTRQPDEIVIADGGSTDGTWEFLQEQQAKGRVKALQEKKCNVARGRNLAIGAASHDLIASTDIGCEWEPQWLEELTAPLLRDETCEAVMGSWHVRAEDLKSDWSRVEFAVLDGPKLLATPKSHASSRAIAYRKSLWKKIGGYPEELTLAADDMVYALLLHAMTTNTAAAPVPRCSWERPATLKSFCKEARRNFKGAGEAGIWFDHGMLVGTRLAAEFFLPIIGIVLVAICMITPGIGCIILGFLIIASRLVRLIPAAQRAAKLGVPGAWWRVVVFEYLTKFWGIVGYWEGWRLGSQKMRDCRERLRRAGVR
jgi:glycosyltransferase involved in cell wall biosynthesis